MITNSEKLNESLVGFTDVRELSVTSEYPEGSYDLRITLCDASVRTISLTCQDISNFELKKFGGGLTQFMVLRATDMRASQLDRVTFHIEDLESEGIVLDCANAFVELLSDYRGSSWAKSEQP